MYLLTTLFVHESALERVINIFCRATAWWGYTVRPFISLSVICSSVLSSVRRLSTVHPFFVRSSVDPFVSSRVGAIQTCCPATGWCIAVSVRPAVHRHGSLLHKNSAARKLIPLFTKVQFVQLGLAALSACWSVL